jgi:N-acetylmuramoyl-L-alanine amidase
VRFRHILFLLALCTFTSAAASKGFTIKTVVIDAGHGGKDPGAVGPGKNYEKDAALAVALRFGQYIEENFPDVKVVYTRKTDVFIELHQRAEIANKAKADLFVAIHCNSSPNSDFYGTSSYILGLHRSEANLEVAKRENAVILLEEDRDKNYEFNPNTPEGHIIMSMKQNAFLEQSIDFAAKIENQLENYAKRKSLGVKQAGFYVLYKTAMPSLLAEIGFISNPEEEKYLTSEKGQDQIAAGLFNAFRDYKIAMEGSETETKVVAVEQKKPEPVMKEAVMATKSIPKEEPAPTTIKEPGVVVIKSAPKEEPAPVIVKEPEVAVTPSARKEDIASPAPVITKEAPPSAIVKAESDVVTLSDGNKIRKPVESSGGGGKTTASIDLASEKSAPAPTVTKESKPTPPETPPAKPVVKEVTPVSTTTKTTVTEVKTTTTAVKTETKPAAPVVKEPKPVTASTTSTTAPSNRHPLVPVIEAESGPVFKIQLFALKGQLKDYDKFIKLFKLLGAEELPNGITRYYGANTSSYAEAKRFHGLAVSNGYKDAYIVGFKNGKRMSFEELKEFEGE